MANTRRKTAFIVCAVELDPVNDYRFGQDAARWVLLAEKRGIPAEDIYVRGQVLTSFDASISANLIQIRYLIGRNVLEQLLADHGANAGVQPDAFQRIMTTYYRQCDAPALLHLVTACYAQYERITLILLNRGARDGGFGQHTHPLSKQVFLLVRRFIALTVIW
jgi:hypothetical protein